MTRDAYLGWWVGLIAVGLVIGFGITIMTVPDLVVRLYAAVVTGAALADLLYRRALR